MMCFRTLCLTTLAMLLLAGGVRAAEIDFAKELEARLPDMSSDDLGKRGRAQTTFSEMCLAAARPGAEGERKAACDAILAKLGPDTAEEARVWLLRQLQYIGQAECVPALADLLDDKTPRIRECARRALQDNPAPVAASALRVALAKASTSGWRIALVNALAQRGDAASVGAIATLLADRDESVALAAAAGLGKIGGTEAARALNGARGKGSEGVRAVVLDSYLLCADKLVAAGQGNDAAGIYKALYAAGNPPRVRIAALRGLCLALGDGAVPTVANVLQGQDDALRAAALTFVGDIPGAKATKALADLLPRLDASMQVTLLGALASREDPAARPAILAAVDSQDESIRVAALAALADVGQPEDALLLAKTAAETQGTIQNAARSSLGGLPGDGVDKAMLSGIAKAAPKVRAELVRALTARRAEEAMPTFVRLAHDPDETIRLEALRGLEAVGDSQAHSLLVGIVKSPKGPKDREGAERAIAAICGRTPANGKDEVAERITKDLAGTSGEVRSALLRPLAKIGGDKAVQPVRAALKDTDETVRNTAVRVIADWPDDAARDDMLAIAKDDPKIGNQVLAIRGYVRLAKQRDRQADDQLQMCEKAMAAATRPDEKKLVLGVLRDLRSLGALRLAAPLMDDPALAGEASSASVRVARNIGGKLPDDVKTAMEKALQVTKDNRTRRDAEAVLKKYEGQQKK